MFKLLSELNIDNKNYKNLALLPGFNINEVNKLNETYQLLNKKLDGTDILDEKIFIKLITVVDETNKKNKKNLTRKKNRDNQKKMKGSRKKK